MWRSLSWIPRRCRHSLLKLLGFSFLFAGSSLLMRSATDLDLSVRTVASVTRSTTEASFTESIPQNKELTPALTEGSVNPHPFVFTNRPSQMCSDAQDVTLLVYVHSTPRYVDRRMRIRNTWGNTTWYSRPVRVVFVVGITPGNPMIQTAIDRESLMYDDMIQENFVDSYRNLTYKAICGLRWATTYCQQAQYILKTDDDIMVDMFALLELLPPRARESPPAPGGLMCKVWSSMMVQRQGKWAVSWDEYGEYSYPLYCSGMAYIMTSDVAQALYRTSYDVPFFWVDDVYLTGLVAMKLSMQHTDISAFYTIVKSRLDREAFINKSLEYTYVFGHIKPENAYDIWDYLLEAMHIRRHRGAGPVGNLQVPAAQGVKPAYDFSNTTIFKPTINAFTTSTVSSTVKHRT